MRKVERTVESRANCSRAVLVDVEVVDDCVRVSTDQRASTIATPRARTFAVKELPVTVRTDRQGEVERVGIARVEGEVAGTAVELRTQVSASPRELGELLAHLEGVGEADDPVEHVEVVPLLEHEQGKALLLSTSADAPSAREVAVARVEEGSFDLEERRAFHERLGLGKDGGDWARTGSAGQRDSREHLSSL